MPKFPTVRTPTIEELLDIADAFGMSISVEEAESYQGMMAGTIQSYHRIDDLVEPKLPVKYPRTPGRRPTRRWWQSGLKRSGWAGARSAGATQTRIFRGHRRRRMWE